jgi:hypothetical protein
MKLRSGLALVGATSSGAPLLRRQLSDGWTKLSIATGGQAPRGAHEWRKPSGCSRRPDRPLRDACVLEKLLGIRQRQAIVLMHR